jgi:hypothetical protein
MNISLNPHFEDAPKCQGTLARTLTYAAQPVFGLPQDTDAGCYRIVGAKCHRIRVGWVNSFIVNPTFPHEFVGLRKACNPTYAAPFKTFDG